MLNTFFLLLVLLFLGGVFFGLFSFWESASPENNREQAEKIFRRGVVITTLSVIGLVVSLISLLLIP